MRKIFSLMSAWYVTLGVAIGIVIPMVLTMVNANDVIKIGISLFVINVIYSIAIGFIVGSSNHGLIIIFYFPVIFAVGVLCGLFQGITIYFAIIYLCLSLLSWGITRD